MKPTKDNFSKQSKTYAQFRPGYPDGLYDFLFSQLTAFERAWDCGTGNGQVAVKLAERFEVVLATDISEAQLSHAPEKENIMYRVTRAEQTDLPMEFFDLITVGQAMHWFDFEPFFAEAKRVARTGSWMAAWGYGLCEMEGKMNKIIKNFYAGTLDTYWDPERKHIDTAYAEIPFPFLPIPTPELKEEVSWTRDQMEGFFRSWSAVQHYIKATGNDPVDELMKAIKKEWPDGEARTVTFPIFLKMGQMY